MAINWKKTGLWGGGIAIALVIGYALWKYEMNASTANAQAASEQNASDLEAAQSFAPQVGLGGGSSSPASAPIESPVGTTSSGVDPSILAIIQALQGNSGAAPPPTTPPVTTTNPPVPVTPVGPAPITTPRNGGSNTGTTGPVSVTPVSGPVPVSVQRPQPPLKQVNSHSVGGATPQPVFNYRHMQPGVNNS